MGVGRIRLAGIRGGGVRVEFMSDLVQRCGSLRVMRFAAQAVELGQQLELLDHGIELAFTLRYAGNCVPVSSDQICNRVLKRPFDHVYCQFGVRRHYCIEEMVASRETQARDVGATLCGFDESVQFGGVELVQ